MKRKAISDEVGMNDDDQFCSGKRLENAGRRPVKHTKEYRVMMTSQDFMEWRNATGCRFAERFVDAVGVSRGTAQAYYRAAKAGKEVPISQSVALAMSAVAAGLKPWGEKRRDESRAR